jgi:hypothetical protein
MIVALDPLPAKYLCFRSAFGIPRLRSSGLNMFNNISNFYRDVIWGGQWMTPFLMMTQP